MAGPVHGMIASNNSEKDTGPSDDASGASAASPPPLSAAETEFPVRGRRLFGGVLGHEVQLFVAQHVEQEVVKFLVHHLRQEK